MDQYPQIKIKLKPAITEYIYMHLPYSLVTENN